MAWGAYAALFILLLAVIAWLTLPRLMGWQAQVVLSGSMEPAMPTGSVAFVQPIEPEQLDVGDIISFYHPEETSRVVTHRLTEIVRQDGNLVFQTRGDANDAADPWLVPAADVIGTARFSVPYTGYVTQRLRSPLGFALLVGIPAAVIVLGELRNIVRQLRRPREGIGP
jgi:signal peptidase